MGDGEGYNERKEGERSHFSYPLQFMLTIPAVPFPVVHLLFPLDTSPGAQDVWLTSTMSM